MVIVSTIDSQLENLHESVIVPTTDAQSSTLHEMVIVPTIDAQRIYTWLALYQR